jgi:aryl-alcohol dehydrogenase-like predicted oxidoreductase
VSPSISLGTFPLASPFSKVTRGEGERILGAYFDAGGVAINTAPTYGFGEVERLLGAFFQELPRGAYTISTSCGYVWAGGAYRVSGSVDSVTRSIEESLGRLGIDYVDYYFSHVPDPETPLEVTAAALQAVKEKGLALNLGVSNVNAEQLIRYCSGAEISQVQNRLSYLNRTLGADLLAALNDSGATLVAYQALERGLLTGRGVPDLSAGDLRLTKPEFRAECSRWIAELVNRKLVALAESCGISIEQLAVRWTLSQAAVSLVQVGASTSGQARTIPTYAGRLSDSLLGELESVYREAVGEVRRLGYPTIRAYMGVDDDDFASGNPAGQTIDD